ncbi:MAG: BMC domain-containing protein [Desulfoprunum sp.]|nr:BMC domain-containing protein [Desulfoprunum sp.]
MPALGLVETAGIAAGVGLADRMVKEADVNLLRATTICGGRYMIQVEGDRAAVAAALAVAAEDGSRIIGKYLIPQVSSEVLDALRRPSGVRLGQAIAVVEARTATSGIVAADAAVKAAAVSLAKLVTGQGINGKSYCVFCGELSSVEAGVRAAVDVLANNLIDTMVLAAPDQAVLGELTRILG